MKALNLIQGTPEWLAARRDYFTASEAPAAMGHGKYMTRSKLLELKATGAAEPVDAGTQRLFDAGHATEAAARPLAEGIIERERGVGGGLFPAVVVKDFPGGLKLLASLDGATLDDSILYEHKLYSEELARAVRDFRAGVAQLPEHYSIQMDQQLMITGASACLFVVSDGTAAKFEFCWYTSGESRREKLLAGWRQFAADLAAWEKPVESVAVVGVAPENLPALTVEAVGSITTSTIDDFKSYAIRVFKQINLAPATEQEFADADKAAKWCGVVEERLETAKDRVLQQTATIHSLFSVIDELSNEARSMRLVLEKVVNGRKAALKNEAIADAEAKLAAHIKEIEGNLSCDLAPVPHDFALAVKGKKSIDTIRVAIDAELARAKVAATMAGETHARRAAMIFAVPHEYRRLFHDFGSLIKLPDEELATTIAARIDIQKQADELTLERLQKEAAAAVANPPVQAAPDAPSVAAVVGSLSLDMEPTPETLNAGNQRALHSDRELLNRLALRGVGPGVFAALGMVPVVFDAPISDDMTVSFYKENFQQFAIKFISHINHKIESR